MAIDTTVTLKRQIVELNEWATAHPMVNDFGYGQYLEVYKQSGNKYLTLVVNSPTLTSEDFFVNYSWEVICLDYVLDQKDNMQRVLSDTQDVLRDLENTIRYSKRWKEFSRADGNWSYRKVDEFGADKCFGWIATFTLKIKKKHGICDIKSLMPTYDFETGSIVYPTCDPVLFAINGTDEDSFASGSTFNMLLVNQDGDIPAYSFDEVLGKLTVQTGGGSVDIEINGNTFLSGQTGTVDISVWNENDDPTGFDDGGIWRIGNSVVNVNDDTIAQLVPSSNLNLYVKDSSGNNVGTPNNPNTVVDDSTITLITQSVPDALTPLRAEQPKSLSIIDAIDFDPIQVTVASDTESAATFVIPNGQVLVKDSAGTTLHTKVVKAGGSANQTVSDVTQTLNGAAITNNKAETSKAIIIRYANNDPVVVTPITDTETSFIGEVPDVVVPLNTSNPFKTGQTTSYVTNDDGALERGNGVDFTTLSHNNYFGNTNRFTDILGGQTYSDNWIIDWSTYNQLTGDFIMWNRTYEAAATWANALAAQPYTRGIYADCYIPNESELYSLLNRGVTPSTNYAPFNLNVTAGNNGLWTSTTVPNNTLAAYYFTGSVSNNLMAGAAKTVNQRFILMRYGNISEL